MQSRHEKIDFWDSVYGLNFRAIRHLAMAGEALSMPVPLAAHMLGIACVMLLRNLVRHRLHGSAPEADSMHARAEPLVDMVEAEQVATNAACVLTLDLNTMTKTEATYKVALHAFLPACLLLALARLDAVSCCFAYGLLSAISACLPHAPYQRRSAEPSLAMAVSSSTSSSPLPYIAC